MIVALAVTSTLAAFFAALVVVLAVVFHRREQVWARERDDLVRLRHPNYRLETRSAPAMFIPADEEDDEAMLAEWGRAR